MHDVVAAAAEVLVQARVVGVQVIVGVRGGGVRGVGVALLLAPSPPRRRGCPGGAPAATAAWIAEPSAGPWSEPITV